MAGFPATLVALKQRLGGFARPVPVFMVDTVHIWMIISSDIKRGLVTG